MPLSQGPHQAHHRGVHPQEDAEEPPKDNDAEGEGIPKVKNCLLIFGGRTAHLTVSHTKELSSYLKWLENAITFDR